MFYIVITTCMISWWDLANSQPFCSIIPQPSCRWITQHSSCYLFQFKIFNIYAHNLILGVLAHFYSPFWELEKVLGSQTQLSAGGTLPTLCQWASFGRVCQWLAVRFDLPLCFKKQKTKNAIYIRGFPRPSAPLHHHHMCHLLHRSRFLFTHVEIQRLENIFYT